jgi:hypothetical protein
MSETSGKTRVAVFVLLGQDFGANTWRQKHTLGLIPGSER